MVNVGHHFESMHTLIDRKKHRVHINGEVLVNFSVFSRFVKREVDQEHHVRSKKQILEGAHQLLKNYPDWLGFHQVGIRNRIQNWALVGFGS
jgi:hypothetical protein